MNVENLSSRAGASEVECRLIEHAAVVAVVFVYMAEVEYLSCGHFFLGDVEDAYHSVVHLEVVSECFVEHVRCKQIFGMLGAYFGSPVDSVGDDH